MTATDLRGQSPERLREESLGELLSRLGSDASLLVRQELQLAQQEMKEKAVATGTGAAMIVVGLVLMLAVLGAGTAAAIAGFHKLLPVWAAALATMGAIGIVAGFVVLIGLLRLRAAVPPVPERAITAAKETPGELIG